MIDKPNILVLGATGKVGGEVVSQLIDTEHHFMTGIFRDVISIAC